MSPGHKVPGFFLFRIGAILSPFIGSYMIAGKWPHVPMFVTIGVPSLIAAFAFTGLALHYSAT